MKMSIFELGFFPDFDTAEDIVSIFLFIFCILIVRNKVFVQYFGESKPSILKRSTISFCCGIGVACIVLSFGVIIELIDLVAGNSYWNIFSTILTITSISIRDIFKIIRDPRKM